MGKETSDRIEIREANTSDVSSIFKIGTRCFNDAWQENTVADDLSRTHSKYWVAEVNHRVVGYACFWFILDEAQLVNIGVDPIFRKQGVAKTLLIEGIRESRKRRMKTLFLEVRVGNLQAQALYRKYGLKVISLRKNVYSYPKEDGYIMSCIL